MKQFGVVIQTETYLQIEAEDIDEARFLAEQGQGRTINSDDVKVIDVFFEKEI